MALGIVQELMGDKYTQGVMLDLEYDPEPPIEAGSVTNTDDLVIEMMRTMYDSGLLPMIESGQVYLPVRARWQDRPILRRGGRQDGADHGVHERHRSPAPGRFGFCRCRRTHPRGA